MTSDLKKRVKEVLLYYIQMIVILLLFHVIMFCISGDQMKYDILAIVPWEIGVALFLMLILGEQYRVEKQKNKDLSERIRKLELEKEKIINR